MLIIIQNDAMEIIVGIAGLILFAKIVLHIYLVSKIDEDFDFTSEFVTINPEVAFKWGKRLFLPSFENVPRKLKTLKTFINVLYISAIVGLMVFLIFITIFKKN